MLNDFLPMPIPSRDSAGPSPSTGTAWPIWLDPAHGGRHVSHAAPLGFLTLRSTT